MVAMAAGPIPLLTPDEVDRTLARLTLDGDRIAGALVALETHPGYQFLTGARPAGRTATLWARTQADITLLYQWFGAYRTVMDNAAVVRARRTKPGVTELTELTALLRGSAVELATEEIPLERRNVAGPSTVTRRMTLAELVAAMDTTYQRATEVVVAADEAWSEFVRLADALEQRLDAGRELAGSLGLGEVRDPLFTALGDIGTDLADVRARAFADPLAFYRGEVGAGKPDLGEVTVLADRLAAVRTDLDALAATRAGFDERVGRARGAIDALTELTAAATKAHELVLTKIADVPATEVPFEADRLRGRVAGLA